MLNFSGSAKEPVPLLRTAGIGEEVTQCLWRPHGEKGVHIIAKVSGFSTSVFVFF